MNRLNLDGGGQRGQGRTRPQDVKSRTMNRFAVYDEDVASKYDYDEDDPLPPRQVGQGGSRGNNQYAVSNMARAIEGRIEGRNMAGRIQTARRDNQVLRGAGGSARKDIINLITVRNAGRAGKESVLKLLADSISDFHPIAPRINAGNVEFFLTSNEDADAVRSMSRRLADKNNPGNKYIITSNRHAAPWDQLRPNVKHLIEQVVMSRYSAMSNSLDLSDFANEKKFTEANIHCALFNNAVIVHVSDVIARHFSAIQGLSLKGNRLRALDFVSTLVYVAPKVIELDLSSNALTRIEELDRIRGWHIEKLHLENNECVARYSDASTYTSTIHDYFPRVNYLDGVFVNRNPFKLNESDEDGSEASLVPYRPGYCPDPNIQAHVETFLLEYINLYDGPSGEETRKRLMNAYDDNATFTFALHTLQDSCRVPQGDSEAYSNYIRSSHNILRDSKWGNYRDKIVYKGSMDVAVALSKLPLTTHVKDSFVLDFNLVTGNLVVFTLQGILRDGNDAFSLAGGDNKFFVRNFVVIPKTDNTMAILSDMLTLTPIGPERTMRYRELLRKASDPAQQPQSSQLVTPFNPMDVSQGMTMNGNNAFAPQLPATIQPQPIVIASPQSVLPAPNVVVNPTPVASNAVYDVTDPTIQQEMIRQFSEISGMKPEWSQKCLSDMNYDFEAAGKVFNEMRASIPPEAFRN